jgi:hypothetical protein
VGHPKIRNLPLLLEVPGDGDGPRASDVAKARRVVTAKYQALRAGQEDPDQRSPRGREEDGPKKSPRRSADADGEVAKKSTREEVPKKATKTTKR